MKVTAEFRREAHLEVVGPAQARGRHASFLWPEVAHWLLKLATYRRTQRIGLLPVVVILGQVRADQLLLLLDSFQLLPQLLLSCLLKV